MISVGIFARTFPGNDPSAVLKSVRAAGYRVAQYNMACSGLPSLPDSIPDGVAEAVTAAARATDVALVGVSATYNMIHPDPAERRRGQDSLAVIATAARTMGVPLLTLCTGTRDPNNQWRRHRDNDTPEAWRDLLASMQKAIAVAEQFDLDLGIEPEQANVIDSAVQTRRLFGEMDSPRLKVIIDPANLFEREDAGARRRIVERAIDTLADRIVVAHAKDRDADGKVAPAGNGIIDYPHYLRCLRAIGFDGPLITHELDPAEAPRVGGWLRSLSEADLG